MELGPVQILVVGIRRGRLEGKALDELRRLREHAMVRLLDLLVVKKDRAGAIATVELSGLAREQEEDTELGAIAGALLGLDAAGEEKAGKGPMAGRESGAEGSLVEEEVWYLSDSIPPGTAALIALLEHRWAIPLRDAILEAGGATLLDSWLHPVDLIAVGAAARSKDV